MTDLVATSDCKYLTILLLQAREQRLRKAGISERARMAGQMRYMDDEVSPCISINCQIHLSCGLSPS